MSDVPPGDDQHGRTAPPPERQPPPGWTPPAPGLAAHGGNRSAVAGLVLAIFAGLLCWLPFVGLGLAVLALVFSILGLKKAKRGEAGGRGLAVGGVVVGGIALPLALLFTVALVALLNNEEFRDLTDCLAQAETAADEANCRELFEQGVGR
ncbi:MAG: hypothetical protein M3P53_08905 [Actinomycetota bacterium]|nr:hypothetical protein [Actinomycetota bacterium]